jgi:hypothetical protein
VTEEERFVAAVDRLRSLHAEDPRREMGVPFALTYHEALARWVERLTPEAPLSVRLAAWCQHLRRHQVPRDGFPEGLVGYKKWRVTAAVHQANEASGVLRATGYDDETIARVSDLVLKKGIKHDPEVQLFEDAICLTFLELELEAFAEKHPEDKVIDVLRKTWAKMTPRGHAAATELSAALPPTLAAMVSRAIG